MTQTKCLRSLVAIDPGLVGFADVVDDFARLLNAVVDAEREFVAQLVGLPIWLGFDSDTVVERYLIRKEIHYHEGTRPSVEFMLGFS